MPVGNEQTIPSTSTTALDDLSDVIITTPSNGQVIKYNGANWVNDTDATGGGGAAWGGITGTLSAQTDLQTALDGKVDENTAITGATKTKVTYDAKGLVTAGADATTADIADSINKRYVTDAQQTVIGNTSGTNTGDQTSIVGITGTKAQFDTAVSDGNIMYIGDAPTAHTHPQSDVTNLTTDLAAKQATLVSGTNIKTVNSTTLLGSGNLAVQETLVSATNIKTINGSSVLGSGNLVVSGATSITQTEIDFGTTPLSEQTFTITDAAAIVGSKIIATLAYDAPTGKDLDELDMDDIVIKCGNATTGSFSMYVCSNDGSYLADKFKINYVIA
jgi:hypothetical protein